MILQPWGLCSPSLRRRVLQQGERGSYGDFWLFGDCGIAAGTDGGDTARQGQLWSWVQQGWAPGGGREGLPSAPSVTLCPSFLQIQTSKLRLR